MNEYEVDGWGIKFCSRFFYFLLEFFPIYYRFFWIFLQFFLNLFRLFPPFFPDFYRSFEFLPRFLEFFLNLFRLFPHFFSIIFCSFSRLFPSVDLRSRMWRGRGDARTAGPPAGCSRTRGSPPVKRNEISKKNSKFQHFLQLHIKSNAKNLFDHLNDQRRLGADALGELHRLGHHLLRREHL